jgi:hypothetical protein
LSELSSIFLITSTLESYLSSSLIMLCYSGPANKGSLSIVKCTGKILFSDRIEDYGTSNTVSFEQFTKINISLQRFR